MDTLQINAPVKMDLESGREEKQLMRLWIEHTFAVSTATTESKVLKVSSSVSPSAPMYLYSSSLFF